MSLRNDFFGPVGPQGTKVVGVVFALPLQLLVVVGLSVICDNGWRNSGLQSAIHRQGALSSSCT